MELFYIVKNTFGYSTRIGVETPYHRYIDLKSVQYHYKSSMIDHDQQSRDQSTRTQK